MPPTDPHEHQRRLIEALVGEDLDRRKLYLTSASFHAAVYAYAETARRTIDLMASVAEREQAEIDDALREMLDAG